MPLIAQGTTDTQVSVRDSMLLAAADPSARLVVIDGMCHVLKDATSDDSSQQRACSDPSLPLDPTLASAVVTFAAAR
jgi:hypothetical protein